MIPAKLWLKLVVSLLPIQFSTPRENEITSFSATGIIQDFQRYLSTGCISIILEDFSSSLSEFTEKHQAAEATARLSASGIPVAILNYASSQLTKCQKNLPLNVLLSSTNETRTYLEKVSTHNMLRSSSWLLYLTTNIAIDDFFKGIDIPFDCLFLVAQANGPGTVLITEVYRVESSLSLTKMLYCTWNGYSNLNCSKLSLLARRSTLQGFGMKIVVPNTDSVEDEGSSHLKEFFHQTWQNIANNVQLKLLSINGPAPSPEPCANSSLTHIRGHILNGSAHIGVDPVGMKGDAMAAIDFTEPLFIFRISLFLREPASAFSWSRFLDPFSEHLWQAVLITMVVLACSLSLLHNVGRICGNAESQGPKIYTFYNSVMYVFGTFCQQGNDLTPRSTSCRIIYWMSYGTAVILLASYSGTLISFLTVKHNPLPFSDLRAFLQDTSYQVGMIKSYSQLFSIPKGHQSLPPSQRLLRRIGRTKNYASTALEGLRNVCESKYALLITSSMVPPLMNQIPCGVKPLPHFSFEVSMSYVIAKGSPYRSIINWKINALRAGGVLKRGFTPVDSSKFTKLHDGLMKVGLGEIAPILLMLVCGALFACCMLLTELCLHRFLRRRKRH